MSRLAVTVNNLTYRYEAQEQYLFHRLNVSFQRGFTGVIGPNGAGKTTLLRLVTGQLSCTEGVIAGVENAVYCAQRTDHAPTALNDLLQDYDAAAYALRGKLGVEDDFLERWNVLSHGERKRAQIACALWLQPDVLAIDEPTNHIDMAARQMLLDSVKRFSGVGLIVSHDRDLLDDLCDQCLWRPIRARVRPERLGR